jgi:hypothetical protein
LARSGGTSAEQSAKKQKKKKKRAECAATSCRGPKGDRGPQGLQGPTGPKGDQGPTGPSNAFAAVRDTGPTVSSTSATAVATLSNLPAGSYVIVAKTEVHSDTNTDVLCTLTAGSDTDKSNAFVGPSGGAGSAFVQMLPMELVHAFSSTGQAQLTCSRDLASNVTVTNTKIIATQVGAATSSAVSG